MALQPDQMLSQYRLVAKLGEGGMGVVWRAVDTTLDRQVAIKVLPDLFSHDPERLARFEREAKLLASLNHPNIATVHGLHRVPDPDAGTEVTFLAMELVDGEDLAARLRRGRLPVEETVAVAVQIAAALEAAHSRGVVHRDLKPANVVLTPEGQAKVLDFGLAKTVESDPGASGALSLSPTITSRGTEAGIILGTAGYMSPEQVRGRPVDRRSDLWSFGCVLHECLTGVQLFRGETVSDSLAAVLRKDPDWTALPAGTPPLLGLLLRRLLTRDPARRVQDAGDARIELEEILEDPEGRALGLGSPVAAEPAPRRGTAWLPWALAATAAMIAILLALRGPASPAPAMAHRLTIPVPGTTEFGDLRAAPPVISPDGKTLVFGLLGDAGQTSLWARSLDDFTARPLENTQNAAFVFWSPDSREVGYFDTGKIKRIEVSTGRIQTVGGASSAFPRGGSWNAAGQILFVPNSNSGIHLIDPPGGPGRAITAPDPDVPDYSHRWPCFLPDGEHFLFTAWTNDLRARAEHAGVFVGSVTGDAEPERILPDASSAVYASPGYLLVIRDDNLIAVPFDPDERRVTGEARVIASGVLHNSGNAYGAFSASEEGTLVYARGKDQVPATLVWYGRDGRSMPAAGEPAAYAKLRVGPSGKQAVTTIPGENGDGQIWILDLVRGVRTRLGNTPWTRENPIWSADGQRILYGTQEKGVLDLEVTRADGSGEQVPVFSTDNDKTPYDWSPDGRFIAYWPFGAGSGTSDIWVHDVEEDTSAPLVEGEFTYQDARFSPDGRWVAYVSDDSGRMEIFVQEFLRDGRLVSGARWQVSTGGGTDPHWREDGGEIVYLDLGHRVMAVAVDPRNARPELGTPEELFLLGGRIVSFAPTADHQRFLVATRAEMENEPIRVVLNWTADLR